MRLFVDLGKDVGRCYIESDAAGQRQSVLELSLELAGEDDSGERGSAEEAGGADGFDFASATGQDDGSNGEALRQFVKKDSDEDENAQPCGDEKAGGDGHAIEKCVDGQAEQDGAVNLAVHLFGVRFFAEMKVRGDGVLEQVNQEKSREDEDQRVGTGEAHGFGNDFDQSHGKHVTRTEREEVLQVAARPFAIHDEVAAEQIASGGDEAEDRGERDTNW